jgi:hypothetical protein
MKRWDNLVVTFEELPGGEPAVDEAATEHYAIWNRGR